MAGFPPVRPNADGCRVCFRRRCRRVTCGRWTRTPVSQSSTETLRSCIQSPVSQLLHNTEPVNINPVSAALWHHEHRSHATCWPLDSLTHTSLLTTWKLIFREHLKKKKLCFQFLAYITLSNVWKALLVFICFFTMNRLLYSTFVSHQHLQNEQIIILSVSLCVFQRSVSRRGRVCRWRTSRATRICPPLCCWSVKHTITMFNRNIFIQKLLVNFTITARN